MAKSDNPSDSFLQAMSLTVENGSPEQSDPFWIHETIDATRWNAAFPYQLLVVKREAGGGYTMPVGTAAPGAGGGVNGGGDWTFTFPFPPESISVAMPFAINGQVTQGGYVEEHGGAPIRMISFNGTLGVLALRPAAATRTTGNLAEAIFGGTIQQARSVATSARNLASDFSSNNTNFKPNLIEDDFTAATDLSKSSGYYQMRVLQNFLENYASFKKTAAGAPYRLALAMWKDQSVYLVTPQQFAASKNAGSPFEYLYSLSFKAWRRINLENVSPNPFSAFTPVALKPNALARALKALLDARDVLENARDIVSAVGGDLDKALFEPLRQTTMFCKDLLNLPLAFSDLPVQILGDCQGAVTGFVATQQAFSGASETFRSQTTKVANAYKGLADAAAAAQTLDTGVGKIEGAGLAVTHPGLDIFFRPHDYYDVLKNIGPGDVNVPPAAIKAIGAERQRIRQLKRIDHEANRDAVLQVQADFEAAVGAGNTTFNTTYKRSNKVSTKTPTSSDFKVIFALNRVGLELNRLAASGTINQNKLSSISFLAGLARGAGIAFTEPASKFAIPYPYGETIEQVAKRYLGDPDRWIEIVALNGLRSPYVDEVGFDTPLLTNGNGNQVVVADAFNLYHGQQVVLASTSTAQTMRRITKIEHLSTTNHVVTLDGDPDLARFHVSAAAVVHAFLPDTVNSQMMIYIPSSRPPAEVDMQLKAIPGLDQFDQLLNVGGVDILLTSTNDLAMTPDGDTRLAIGLANIIQTARLRLSVVQGTLLQHPTFGLPIKVGGSVADLDAKTLLKSVRNLFSDDPTFTGVTSASVLMNGPVANIAMSVGVRGQNQTVPISFALK